MSCAHKSPGRWGSSVRRAVLGALVAALVAALAGGVASAQTLSFKQVGTIPGPADQVGMFKDHVFVIAEKTITFFDVSTPASPKKLSAYTFPEKIWGVRIVGSLAYVAADFFGLGILDLSNPAAVTLRGSLKLPGQAKNVALVGTKALIADHMSGVDYVDVADPSKPTNIGSFFLDGYARDVVSEGKFAYAVDSPAGIYVFDLSQPGELEPVGSEQSANATRLISLLEVAGKRYALMPGGGGHLQIYNVSDPAKPTKVTAFKMPGPALRVAAQGTRVYVADGREGLHVVDLANPAEPKIVAEHKTAAPARDVAINNNLVFVVSGAMPQGNVHPGGGEVLILRQTP